MQQQELQIHRLPLIVTEYTRPIASSSTLSTSSGIVGVGVVGLMVVGSLSAGTKDQRLINAIPDKIKNPLTGSETFYVMKRPGFGTLNTPASGERGSAVHVWSGKGSGTDVISAFGATNSTIYNGTSSLGSTTGKVKFISDTLVGTTANLTFVTDSNTAYYYPNGGALTQITDGDFPGNVGGQTITGNFAFLDGYAFIMTTTGRIYNSDLNSLSAWSASSYISANMLPDAGVGLARYKDQIVAFGKESTEFFSDVGNPTGSPLQLTSQGFINIGAVASRCIKEVDDTVVWVGATSASGIGLYCLEGLQAKKLSNPAIESLLATTNTDELYINVIKLVGKTLITIVSTAIATTYVYCMEDEIWHEWAGNTILWQHMHGVSSNVKYIYAVSEQTTSGKVYLINPTSFSFQDDGSNYTFTIQTSRWDLDNDKRKFLRKLRLIGDKETAAASVDISWSDDDYQTYSTARTVDMSTDFHTLNNCGAFRRRSFTISYAGSTPLRLHGLELELVQGTH